VITLVAAKPIHVSLEAPWDPVMESTLALEVLSSYNTSSYFPMLSLLINERMKEEGFTDEVEYIFDTAERAGFLKPYASKAARQEHKLGTVIPRIELQYQMFDSVVDASLKDCPVIMWSEGEYTCDRTALFALQAPTNPEIPELRLDDRIIGNGDQWLVVYADIDSPEFPDWHEVLLEMAITGRVSYVLRYRPSINVNVRNDKVSLAGHGMRFDVKSTDYLVIDDRMKTNGEDFELNRDAYGSLSNDEVAKLGFAIAERVHNMAGTGSEKFDALQDLVFNIPKHLSHLAADGIPEQDGTISDFSGINTAFLDGIHLDGVSVFEFYTALHNEFALLHTLDSQTPEGTNVPEILTSGLIYGGDDEGNAKKVRYDLTKEGSAIGWVNDIEEDSIYEEMADDLDMLKGFDSPIVPLRRNMHTTVVAGDLTDRRMLAVLFDIVQQASQYIPIQIGIVAPNKEWLSIAKLGRDARQAFLTRLLTGASLVDAAKYANQVYEDLLSDPEEARKLSPHQPLRSAYNFFDRFGVDPEVGPVVFVNGFSFPTDDWMELATTIFESDTKYIRNRNDLERLDSLRDTLFSTGESKRNKILDPLDIEYRPWPLFSPMQIFRNPEDNSEGNSIRHSVLFSSSFSDINSFKIAEALLKRAHAQGDVELVVRPLSGINPKFYASLLDPTYNTFRFSLDLFAAARGHFYEHKSEPRVFTVSQSPAIDAGRLPEESESLIIDGRYIDVSSDDLEPEMLIELLEREASRLRRLRDLVPDIGGAGVASLSAASEERTVITVNDVPDIFVDSKTSNSTLTLLMDPGTAEGQEYLGLGLAAQKAGLKVKIFLTPSELEEQPSQFYQPSLDRHRPIVFDNLSEDVLYSAKLVEPKAWLTVASECEYDLDNVLLNTVGENSLSVKYSLRSLLLEGFISGAKVGGTLLELFTSDGRKISETSVMANLGYFQLQAPNPGVYEICLKENDLSFSTRSGTSECVSSSISNFGGTKIRSTLLDEAPKIQRRTQESLWQALKGMVIKEEKEPQSAQVNIFTVASGHLYERFASIMILSVMRHTKHSVKFWLIENFMSPSFKNLIPDLADEFGFDYEFVSYKWPSWLRKQNVKQREIWGYKMLFLDTLFPQELSDIIFVDSDQIVRTDFQELLDYDLGDAPYAFAPMGDSRAETEPFRFWKQGFWKEALKAKGLLYHISALYRVDLEKFRRNHVGDVMRQTYQRLSANPANLANLDQDLPNIMQSVIPIFSLSEDWLWCETWCSDDSLDSAKTIDLCNNPLTKEPKLDRARRQTPEWIEYDETLSKFTEKLKQQKSDQFANPDAKDHSNEHKFDADVEEVDHTEL